MKRVDRLILSNICRPFVFIYFIALAALALEQSVRLTNVLVDEKGPPAAIVQMLVSVLPEYCAQALQLGFFFAILIAFRTMNKEGALTTFHAAGQSFARLLTPVLILSLLFGSAYLFTAGILQPRGEYRFEKTGYYLSHGAYGPPHHDRTWLNIGDGTSVLAQAVDRNTESLFGVFIEQRRTDGSIIATSAKRGRLTRSAIGAGYVLSLRDGRQLINGPAGGRIGEMEFETLTLPIQGPKITEFRAFGSRAKETGLLELFQNSFSREASPNTDRPLRFRLRLAAILAHGLGFIPFAVIAAALGSMSSPRGRDCSLLFGAAIFLSYIQFAGSAEHSEFAGLEKLALALILLVATAIALAYRASQPLQNSFRRKNPSVRGRRGVSWLWLDALKGLPNENVFPRSFMRFSESNPIVRLPRET